MSSRHSQDTSICPYSDGKTHKNFWQTGNMSQCSSVKDHQEQSCGPSSWIYSGCSKGVTEHQGSWRLLWCVRTYTAGGPQALGWAGISCQISANIRLEIKCTINVMCLNHPETTLPSPGLWKNCLPWNQFLCQKCWGLLTYRIWTLAGWVWGASVQDCFPDSSVGKESSCNVGEPGSILGLGKSTGEGIGYPFWYSWASLVAQLVKNPPAIWETWVWSLGWEDPLEKGKATHSSILAWRIPWTMWSMGSQRVGLNWVTLTFRCKTGSLWLGVVRKWGYFYDWASQWVFPVGRAD